MKFQKSALLLVSIFERGRGEVNKGNANVGNNFNVHSRSDDSNANLGGLTTSETSVGSNDGTRSCGRLNWSENCFGKNSHVSHGCSRWQFQCKSSGECIGIYNVCDGIQQCSDGSDEGIELHCPEASNHRFSVPAPQHISHPKQSVQNPVGGAGTAIESSRPEKVGNDHIFNHKSSGLMDQNFGGQLQQQKHLTPFSKEQGYDYGTGDGRPNNPNGIFNGGGSLLSNTLGAYANPNSGLYSYNQNQANLAMNLPQFKVQNNEFQQFQVPPILQQQQPYLRTNSNQQQQSYVPPPNQQNNNILNQGTETENVQNIQPPQIQTTATPKVDLATKPSVNLESNLKTVSNATEKIGSSNSEQESEDRLEKEILNSLRTQTFTGGSSGASVNLGAGAVFLFILGLVMSIVMAVIVSCRLRRVSVGTRRRRKNRLDPDYLVDGMYL